MIAVVLAELRDSVRGCVRLAIESQLDIAVLGDARNESELMAAIARVHPDVVILGADFGSGAAAMTERIMCEAPLPLLVLAGAETDEAARAALHLGAVQVLLCPRGDEASPAEVARLAREVRAAASTKVVRRGARGAEPGEGGKRSVLVGIGASTGGPPALASVLGALPADFPAPVLVVQHMVQEFTHRFADWLGQEIALRVKLAEEGEIPAPGCVYVADVLHLAIDPAGVLRTPDTPPVGGLRPSADVLFHSMAACRSHGLRVGVLLTGMGSDGAAGLGALREAGGHTIAQDEATCVVFGMPRAAIERGAADEVLALGLVGERVAALVARHLAARATPG